MQENLYYFYQTDHLGNYRVVVDQWSPVKQVTHCYPFGISFAESADFDLQP